MGLAKTTPEPISRAELITLANKDRIKVYGELALHATALSISILLLALHPLGLPGAIIRCGIFVQAVSRWWKHRKTAKKVWKKYPRFKARVFRPVAKKVGEKILLTILSLGLDDALLLSSIYNVVSLTNSLQELSNTSIDKAWQASQNVANMPLDLTLNALHVDHEPTWNDVRDHNISPAKCAVLAAAYEVNGLELLKKSVSHVSAPRADSVNKSAYKTKASPQRVAVVAY